jgi:hypothetical protein
MPDLDYIDPDKHANYAFTVNSKNLTVKPGQIYITTISGGKLNLSVTPDGMNDFQAWLSYDFRMPSDAIPLTHCRGFTIYQRPVDAFNRHVKYLTLGMTCEALMELDTAIVQMSSLCDSISDNVEKSYRRYANIRNRVFHNNEENEIKLALELALTHGEKLWKELNG